MTAVMKIPKQAKKVFTGEIFDVYQWEQEMYDGSKATYEMLDRDNTVEIIATIDNKVVLIHEEQPTFEAKYGVVSGRQDDGENPLDCAKRELLEEAGLVSNDWEHWGNIEPFNKLDWIVSRYIARNCKKVSEQNLDPGEKIEVRPVDFDKFIEIALSDNFRSTDVELSILRMKEKGKLKEFKQKLFPN